MRRTLVVAGLLASTHAAAQTRDPYVMMEAIHDGAQREGRMKPVYAVLGAVGASLVVLGPASIWMLWQPTRSPNPPLQLEYTIIGVEITGVGIGTLAISGMSIAKRNPLHGLELDYAHLFRNDALPSWRRYDVLEYALHRAAMQEKQARINRGLVMIASCAGMLLGGLVGLGYTVDPLRTESERNVGVAFTSASFAGAGFTGILTAIMFAIPEPVELVWRQFAPTTK